MPKRKTPKPPPKKTRTAYVPHVEAEKAPPCHVDGCRAPGEYKAPKSRDALHDYKWFCLEHIREHNQQWDFFAGLEPDAIEYFVKDAVTGHRPTWSRENKMRDSYRMLQDALYEFLNDAKPARPTPPLNARMRKALATMEIDYPYTAKSLKVKYREMVKKYHPDMNKGDKASEETFKTITAAYHHLSEHIKNQ